LFFAERLDHAMLNGLFSDPTVAFDRHASPVAKVQMKSDSIAAPAKTRKSSYATAVPNDK
jgi:hypothetical protein